MVAWQCGAVVYGLLWGFEYAATRFQSERDVALGDKKSERDGVANGCITAQEVNKE